MHAESAVVVLVKEPHWRECLCNPVRKMRKSPSGFSAKQSLAFAFPLKDFAFTWLRLLTGQDLIVSSFYICASGTPLFLCYIIDSVPKNIPFRGNHRLYIHFASLNICITVDTRNAPDPVDYRRPGQRKSILVFLSLLASAEPMLYVTLIVIYSY